MTRWGEEIELIKEEFRRSIRFFQFFGDAWDKVKSNNGMEGGSIAFCQKKVDMYQRLTRECERYNQYL